MAQSKWTIADIKTAVASYVAAAKQADASWDPSTESISGLMQKIMKTVTIDGSFVDKLPELDGDELPFGEAIEEYFVNLVPVRDYDDFEGDYEGGDDEGAAADANNRPYRPNFDTVVYDEKLGRKVFATTIDEYKYQEALNGEADLSTLVALIMKRIYDSYSLWKYNQKKQLIGNMIDKAAAVTATVGGETVYPLVEEIAVPTDTESGEAFIKAVKDFAEEAAFVSENTSLSKTTIGAEDGLKLYIKKGIMSSLEVDTLAGAFNAEKLALPCEIKVVEDFGTTTTDAFAVLVDPRGIKLHRNYESMRDHEVAAGDYRNFFLHTEHTGFISTHTYVKVFEAEA